MMWFWSRDNRNLQLETRYDNAKCEFVIVLRDPDGRRDEERFQDVREFGQRLGEWEQQLRADRWQQAGMPLIDPSGFPNRRPPAEWAGRVLHQTPAIARRSYAAGPQAFEITLSRTPLGEESRWVVERVNDSTRGGEEVTIPGMSGIVEPSEGAAFAGACERIDQWLRSNSGPRATTETAD